MLPELLDFASGSLVLFLSAKVEFHGREGFDIFGVSSSGGGLFGRPVILNESGALLICRNQIKHGV